MGLGNATAKGVRELRRGRGLGGACAPGGSAVAGRRVRRAFHRAWRAPADRSSACGGVAGLNVKWQSGRNATCKEMSPPPNGLMRRSLSYVPYMFVLP